MTRSAATATRWSRTTAAFAADLALYIVIGLVFWLTLPMLFLGWTPILITSGSMSPAIEPGDIVLVQRGAPEGEWFVPGTIVTYRDLRPSTAAGDERTDDARDHRASDAPGDPRTGGAPGDPTTGDGLDHRLVTHRVDRIDASGAYITRGDANRSVDPRPVDPTEVVGAARLLLPYLGLPALWLRDGRLLQVAMTAVLLVATVLAGRLDRPDRRQRDEPPTEPRRTVPVRGERADLAVLAIVALSLGGLVPAADAAFTEASVNTGNRFATAPAQDVLVAVDITSDWGEGYCADVTVSTTSTTPIAWDVTIDLGTFPLNGVPTEVSEADWSFDDPQLLASGLDHNDTVVEGGPVIWAYCAERPAGSIPATPLEIPLGESGQPIVAGGGGQGQVFTFEFGVVDDLYLAGPAVVELYARRTGAGGSTSSARITLYADGDELASSTAEDIPGDNQWQLVEVPLTPDLFGDLAAGTTLRLEIQLIRLEMEVDGPSKLVLAGG